MAYVNNYKEIKKSDGTYSKLGFIKRAMQLWSFKSFNSFKNKYFPNAGVFTSVRLFLDAIWCSIIYKTIYDDYFDYRFWEKSHYSRKRFVTKGKSRKIQKIFNKRGSAIFTYNKLTFNKEYVRFKTTKYFEFPGTLDSFGQFVADCNYKIIAKPIFGSAGQGVFVPNVSSEEEIEKLYRQLSSDKSYFCEEFFVQSGPLGEVNPTSVNTVRIVTLNDGVDIHIMVAFVRFGGKDAVVDNFHSQGFGCEVDIETGIIVSGGVDKQGKRVYVHPASGKIVCGIKIPQWEKVISTAKEAAKVHPEIGFTGWDFAVSNDKINIIEANEQPNFGIQGRTGRGVLPEYQEIIKLRKKNLKNKVINW